MPSRPNEERWRNTIEIARNKMVAEGLLKNDSPFGIWELPHTSTTVRCERGVAGWTRRPKTKVEDVCKEVGLFLKGKKINPTICGKIRKEIEASFAAKIPCSSDDAIAIAKRYIVAV